MNIIIVECVYGRTKRLRNINYLNWLSWSVYLHGCLSNDVYSYVGHKTCMCGANVYSSYHDDE